MLRRWGTRVTARFVSPAHFVTTVAKRVTFDALSARFAPRHALTPRGTMVTKVPIGSLTARFVTHSLTTMIRLFASMCLFHKCEVR